MKEPPATPGQPSDPPPGAAQDDRPLVARAKSGDLGAYDQLVQLYQQRIYGLCYHRAIHSFRGDSAFYTWIYRVAYNTCLNHLKTRRHRTHHVSLNDLDQNAEHDPGLVELISQNTPRREASLAELQKSLNDALLKLSEEHRTVVVLHDVQGLPHDEIAKIMGCNPGTVRSRLFYARQQLQAWLSDLRK